MNDLISRQDVLKILSSKNVAWDAYDKVKRLPSAQQQRILYANMSDAEFEKWLYEHGICNPNIHESIPCDVVPLLIDYAISELPSAQPGRKKGKWITEVKHYKDESQEFYYEHTRCSNCGAKKRIGWYDANYCPSCGARME